MTDAAQDNIHFQEKKSSAGDDASVRVFGQAKELLGTLDINGDQGSLIPISQSPFYLHYYSSTFGIYSSAFSGTALVSGGIPLEVCPFQGRSRDPFDLRPQSEAYEPVALEFKEEVGGGRKEDSRRFRGAPYITCFTIVLWGNLDVHSVIPRFQFRISPVVLSYLRPRGLLSLCPISKFELLAFDPFQMFALPEKQLPHSHTSN